MVVDGFIRATEFCVMFAAQPVSGHVLLLSHAFAEHSKAAASPAPLPARTSGEECVTGVVCIAAVGCEQGSG